MNDDKVSIPRQQVCAVCKDERCNNGFGGAMLLHKRAYTQAEIDDLYQQGLDDGHSAQAIMELQGRDRFITELKSKEATALAAARRETWEKAVTILKANLHEHPSDEMAELCGNNTVIQPLAAALEAAAKEGE